METEEPLKHQHVIGVDEVGWGCVAGPIVVCAASVPFGHWDTLRKQGFRDSKQVGNRLVVSKSPRTRYTKKTCDSLAQWLNEPEQQGLATWAIAEVDAIKIDLDDNPMASKNAAFRTAIMRLMQANGWTSDDVTIIVDGNQLIPLPPTFVQEAIPKADDSVMPVAVASILAKSKRDQFMRHLAHQYGTFGFENHVGYPTPQHMKAVFTYGPIKGVHRMRTIKPMVLNWYTNEYCYKQQKRNPPPAWLVNTGWLGEAYAR